MEAKIKKVNIVFLCAILIMTMCNIGMFLIKRYQTLKLANAEIINKNISIMIDAGHGGIDCGAVSKYGDNEAPINLQISNYLMSLLDSSGFNVEMTRYTEDGLYDQSVKTTIRHRKNEDLRKRVELINKSDADLVISVHLNSFPEEKYYGAQTFYKKGQDEGRIASQIIQENLRKVLDVNNKRVPQIKKGVKVIENSEKTIVLVECGFVSNAKEGKLLTSSDYQQKVAWSIYSGIIKYFEGKI